MTFQVSIAEVERLTQLTFTVTVSGQRVSLGDFDSLRGGVARRLARRRHIDRDEEVLVGVKSSNAELLSLEDIVR